MTNDATAGSAAPHLTAAGIGRLLTVVLMLALTATIYFLAAGTLAVPRAWIYYGGLLAYLVVAMALIFVRFPEVAETINERGRRHKGVKTWDKLIALGYTALTFISPAVAGLDVGRWRAYEVPAWLVTPALIVTILAYAFVHWAMVVNKHAETGVRIQTDRDHHVVASGPYRIVRHPFYISLIVVQLVYPLAVGSYVAYAPGLMMAALFVWRTAREDATLRRELAGYEAFTGRTRSRLVPGVW